MDGIKVRLVKSHDNQNKNFNVQKEMKSIQNMLDHTKYEMDHDTVYLMFLKGIYDNYTKKMTTAFLFINHTGNAINEIHGVIRLKAKDHTFQIAKTTIDFDREFLGRVENQEAVLVHLNIPVKGLQENKEFSSKEIIGEFSEVKISYDESVNEKNL